MGLPPQPTKPVQPVSGPGDLGKRAEYTMESRVPILLGGYPLQRDAITATADVVQLVGACPNGAHRLVVDAVAYPLNANVGSLVRLEIRKADGTARTVAVQDTYGPAAGPFSSAAHLRHPIALEPGDSLWAVDELTLGNDIVGGAGYLDVMA